MKNWLSVLFCLIFLAGCTKPLTLTVKDTMKSRDRFQVVFSQNGLAPEGYRVHFLVEKYVDGKKTIIADGYTDEIRAKKIITFSIKNEESPAMTTISFGTSDMISRVKEEPIQHPYYSGVLVDSLEIEPNDSHSIAYIYANSLTVEQQKMFEEGEIDVEKLKDEGLLYVLVVEVVEK